MKRDEFIGSDADVLSKLVLLVMGAMMLFFLTLTGVLAVVRVHWTKKFSAKKCSSNRVLSLFDKAK
jgi:hypothetical protein